MPELLISWVVLGVIAGFGVYLFSNKRLAGGIFGNVIVGVVGALLGGYLISTATSVDILEASLTWGILLTSVVSAIVVGIVVQSQAPVRAKK